MPGKSPMTSKTLWANILALAALAVQTKTGFIVPAEAQAAALGIGNLALRLATGQPIDWRQVKLPGMGTLGLLLIIGGLTLLPLVSGCALVKVAEERPVLTELAVRIAAGRVLEARPGWTEQARDISASALRALDESEQVDLAALESAVLARIPWDNLMVEEQELVTVLIRAVRSEIESELARSGVTAPDQVKVRVAAVLGWIYQVADARLQRQASADKGANQEWPTVQSAREWPDLRRALDQSDTFERQAIASYFRGDRPNGDGLMLLAQASLNDARDLLALEMGRWLGPAGSW